MVHVNGICVEKGPALKKAADCLLPALPLAQRGTLMLPQSKSFFSRHPWVYSFIVLCWTKTHNTHKPTHAKDTKLWNVQKTRGLLIVKGEVIKEGNSFHRLVASLENLNIVQGKNVLGLTPASASPWFETRCATLCRSNPSKSHNVLDLLAKLADNVGLL